MDSRRYVHTLAVKQVTFISVAKRFISVLVSASSEGPVQNLWCLCLWHECDVISLQAERELNDDGESKLRTALREQQQRLRAKLAQIAGEKEVEAHDREQREAEAKRAAGTLSAQGSTAATVAKTHGVTGLESAQAPSQQSSHVGGMTNEQLAHELLLDSDFRLDDKVGVRYALCSLVAASLARYAPIFCLCRLSLTVFFSPRLQAGMSDDKLVHTKIRETFERAFWESLVDDLSATPPSYNRVLSVLNEISNGVQVCVTLNPLLVHVFLLDIFRLKFMPECLIQVPMIAQLMDIMVRAEPFSRTPRVAADSRHHRH